MSDVTFPFSTVKIQLFIREFEKAHPNKSYFGTVSVESFIDFLNLLKRYATDPAFHMHHTYDNNGVCYYLKRHAPKIFPEMLPMTFDIYQMMDVMVPFFINGAQFKYPKLKFRAPSAYRYHYICEKDGVTPERIAFCQYVVDYFTQVDL